MLASIFGASTCLIHAAAWCSVAAITQCPGSIRQVETPKICKHFFGVPPCLSRDAHGEK